jgi:acyl-coenzyme A thioesterase PaaI-like protein
MSKILRGYNKLCGFPGGKYIFSFIICRIAPYFKTIRPRFVELKPGYCEVTMKNRRAVRNHLNSVHAIAMCNLCELVGGTALEVSLPGHLRWIPRGMNVEYIKIAKTDLRGTCTIAESDLTKAGSLPVTVHVIDKSETEVMRAIIDMHVTEQKKSSH